MDVTYTEEDIGLPPLPQEPHSPEPPIPDGDPAGPPLPQLPDPEPLKSMEEVASDFHDLLAEQGVSNSYAQNVNNGHRVMMMNRG